MCQSCFLSHWDHRSPTESLTSLPQDRLDLIRTTGEFLCAESGLAPGPGYWQGGRLHAAVDDDNYECGPYVAPDDTDPLTPAEEHWLLLDEDERSIVVAVLHGYDIPAGYVT